MKVLTLIRGLPGSGKSTLAHTIAESKDCHHYEADDYFMVDGVYTFDPAKISAAHSYCKNATASSMKQGVESVIVSNTFTQKWEILPYIRLAKLYNYEVQLISCQSNFGSIHGVPEESLQRMKNRWEDFSLDDLLSQS